MKELFFAYLSTRPGYADPVECMQSLVGPMRIFLTVFGSLQLLSDFPGMPRAIASIIQERNKAGKDLMDFCERCGRCAWSKPGEVPFTIDS